MSDLRPFKQVQLQWLRLLLADTSLSPRAVQFATYLVVVRYNEEFGKAWPSHATACEDLGLKSEKTIQRLIKELEGKWFEIRRGNGQKQSTEYVPSKASHKAAQHLRNKEEGGKTDIIVSLREHEGRHSCPETRTEMSHEPGQECPPIKEKEKTNEKSAGGVDLWDGKPFAPSRGAKGRVFVAGNSLGAERWRQFCNKMFPFDLNWLADEVKLNGQRGYFLPASEPPWTTSDWPAFRAELIAAGIGQSEPRAAA